MASGDKVEANGSETDHGNEENMKVRRWLIK